LPVFRIEHLLLGFPEGLQQDFHLAFADNFVKR
jgi:hypothetical protein